MRTGEAYAIVLLRLQYIEKSIDEAWLFFRLEVGILVRSENESTGELTYLKSNSA